MGRRSGGSGKGWGKPTPRPVPTECTKLQVVKEWDHLGKKLLKPYADRRGTFLKTNDLAAPKYLEPSNFRDIAADAAVSELVARPTMGLNLFAASCEVGVEALIAAASGQPGTGISDCPETFQSLSNNLATAQIDADVLAAAVKELVKFAQENTDSKLKTLPKLLDSSSRLYSFAARVAQWVVLASKPKAWAKAVPTPPLQHLAVQTWLEDPTNADKLINALTAGITSRFHWGGCHQGKRRLGDSGSDHSHAAKKRKRRSSGSASKASSSSSSTDKKKNKKKQAKRKESKEKKRDKTSESSSHNKKDKKDRKKHKARGRDRSSSLTKNPDKKVLLIALIGVGNDRLGQI